LTGFGCVFLLLGVLLLFDRVLLALGNMVLLAGLVLLIGPKKTVRFFTSKAKIRGSVCFLLGILLCLIGWPVVGMLLELFGIMNLFGNLFPILLTFLRQLPLVGALLRLPVVASLLDRCAGNEYMLPTSMRDA